MNVRRESDSFVKVNALTTGKKHLQLFPKHKKGCPATLNQNLFSGNSFKGRISSSIKTP